MQGRILSFILFICVLIVPLKSQSGNFNAWLDDLRLEAESAGISHSTVSKALNDDLFPIDSVIALDRKQPEKKMTFEEYKKRIVNLQRIKYGQMHMRNDRKILNEIANTYGVNPEYIVALWGMETSYGANTGGFDIIPALVTLSYEGRRSEFFKKELFDALRIVDNGDVGVHAMKGSWAGAMGQCQFMPSSYHAYAVDYNKDGKKDIWNTKEDIFASIANYLSKSGWKKSQPMMKEVRFTKKFSNSEWGSDIVKPISYWKNLGVVYIDGKPLPDSDETVSIVQPGGGNYKKYIAYGNYRIVMKWNKSTYFATAVKYLADQFKKA